MSRSYFAEKTKYSGLSVKAEISWTHSSLCLKTNKILKTTSEDKVHKINIKLFFLFALLVYNIVENNRQT